ncbi:MAG: hypothetical protein J6R47_05420 [Acholeplasmatales bacterium]|nr:hypothetical protein [Acholeplasmatales bacterium]
MIDESTTQLSSPLDASLTEIVNDVINEPDINKTKDLVALFNWNISKKNVVRVHNLNKLFDNVTDQMIERFQKKPDQFSNDDLLNYMKAVQGAIDSSNKILDNVEEPPPQIIQNNTQINVNVVDNFDRESRARILAAVQATLDAAKEQNTIEYEDKTEGEISNESTDN